MSWIDFIHFLQLRILFQAPPKVIAIHLSRNDLLDIGILPMFNLIHLGDCIYFQGMPRFSLYLGRCSAASALVYSYPEDVRIKQKRQRINLFGRRLCKSVHDIHFNMPGFFRNDWTHLSDIGVAMYLDAARDLLLSLLEA